MLSSRIGLGSSIKHAEHATPLWQVADLLPHRLVDALVDELDQFVVVAANTQCAVLRIDELDGSVHDGAQGLVEFQPGGDDQHRVEQPVESITSFDDLLDAVLDFRQQLAKPQLGQAYPASGRLLVSTPDSTSSVTAPYSHQISKWRGFDRFPTQTHTLPSADFSFLATIASRYEVLDLAPIRLLCSVADAAHHLLFHHEVRNVEEGVPDGATAAAYQQASPPVLPTKVETPRPRRFLAVLHALEVVRRHQHQVRVRLDRGHDLARLRRHIGVPAIPCRPPGGVLPFTGESRRRCGSVHPRPVQARNSCRTHRDPRRSGQSMATPLSTGASMVTARVVRGTPARTNSSPGSGQTHSSSLGTPGVHPRLHLGPIQRHRPDHRHQPAQITGRCLPMR